MKRFLALLLLFPGCLDAQESGLTEVDRLLLLEKLKGIEQGSDTTVKGRYSAALSAFQTAMTSNTEAINLFYACHERKQQEQQLRKASEYRDWKNRFKDRRDRPEFRLALRHQLRSLVGAIKAVNGNLSLAERGKLCLATLKDILAEAEDMEGQRDVLSKDPLETIFAETYLIDGLDPDPWPSSPLDATGIFEDLILPPLRAEKDLKGLRNGWLQKIAYIGKVEEAFAREGSADAKRRPAHEQWYLKERPRLLWQMELDLYRHGDEKAASLRMLEHLKKYLNHASAPEWIKQFTQIVEGTEEPEPEPKVPEVTPEQ